MKLIYIHKFWYIKLIIKVNKVLDVDYWQWRFVTFSIHFPTPRNAALQVQIQRSTWENEKLLKDISDLKTTLLSAIGTSDDGQ